MVGWCVGLVGIFTSLVLPLFDRRRCRCCSFRSFLFSLCLGGGGKVFFILPFESRLVVYSFYFTSFCAAPLSRRRYPTTRYVKLKRESDWSFFFWKIFNHPSHCHPWTRSFFGSLFYVLLLLCFVCGWLVWLLLPHCLARLLLHEISIIFPSLYRMVCTIYVWHNRTSWPYVERHGAEFSMHASTYFHIKRWTT